MVIVYSPLASEPKTPGDLAASSNPPTVNRDEAAFHHRERQQL